MRVVLEIADLGIESKVVSDFLIGWRSDAESRFEYRANLTVVGMVGIEPTREIIPKVFETFASANSATSPKIGCPANVSGKGF